jgi:AraC-like DNA-binding protein
MKQMSRGQLRADLQFAQVNGVLLTHESWSHSISATGATPAGYLAVAGSCNNKKFLCSGKDVDDRRVVCALGATDIQFATPDEEQHWVMLVPVEQIVGRLGDDLAVRLAGARGVSANDPRVVRQLGNLVVRAVDKLRDGHGYHADSHLLNEIHFLLLEAVTELLVDSNIGIDRGSSKKRYVAFRRALRHAEKLNRPVSVDELAAQAGVSRRVLEIGFRESLGISPHSYLRQIRLNGMHRELRRASPQSTTVTNTAINWGFTELGRTAVVYRKLFGESPSETLKRGSGSRPARLIDALRG